MKLAVTDDNNVLLNNNYKASQELRGTQLARGRFKLEAIISHSLELDLKLKAIVTEQKEFSSACLYFKSLKNHLEEPHWHILLIFSLHNSHTKFRCMHLNITH